MQIRLPVCHLNNVTLEFESLSNLASRLLDAKVKVTWCGKDFKGHLKSFPHCRSKSNGTETSAHYYLLFTRGQWEVGRYRQSLTYDRLLSDCSKLRWTPPLQSYLWSIFKVLMAALPLKSYDHILDAWQLAYFFSCLQDSAVTWPWFLKFFCQFLVFTVLPVFGNKCPLDKMVSLNNQNVQLTTSAKTLKNWIWSRDALT